MDSDLLRDLVTLRVKEEMNKHTSFARSADLAAELKQPQSSSSSSSIATALPYQGDKEIARIRTEMDKLKTHQSFLDHIYTELKDHVYLREKKAEDAHRRAIHQCRTEMDTTLNDLTRRAAEVLPLGGLRELQDAQSRQEEQQKRSWSRLCALEERERERERHREAAQLLLTLQQLGNVVSAQGDQLNVLRAEVAARHEQLQLQPAMVPVEVDLLAQSVDSLNTKFEGRTDSLRSELATVRAQCARQKARTKSLAESLQTVSDMRRGVESVLMEIDRSGYDHRDSLVRLGLRVDACEQDVSRFVVLVRVQ